MTLKEIRGDIWKFWKGGYYIVIPTNGSIKNNGEAVMGRGLAKQAKDVFADLPLELGSKLSVYGNTVFVFHRRRLITLPVKTFWYEPASLDIIAHSCARLLAIMGVDHEIKTPVYTPRVGCGNGRLDWKDVKPILERHLDDRFIICDVK